MNRKLIYSYIVFSLLFFSMLSCYEDNDDVFSENVKVSLRNVGHQLLLINQDSTSLVLPIIELENYKYRLSFQDHLSFEPSQLVSTVDSAFQKLNLPKHYHVEVIKCVDNEVAYSYEIRAKKENTIIPCGGRFLPKNCYMIEVRFTKKNWSTFRNNIFLFILILGVLLFLIYSYFYKRIQPLISKESDEKHTCIGSYQFYPEQNKLVKAAKEISLSKKECELLEIFVANPNQIIKRDELEKRVWEDYGVFVGRSLDTYISKLRKKLKDDASIKLTNVHGIGYKLEVH